MNDPILERLFAAYQKTCTSTGDTLSEIQSDAFFAALKPYTHLFTGSQADLLRYDDLVEHMGEDDTTKAKGRAKRIVSATRAHCLYDFRSNEPLYICDAVALYKDAHQALISNGYSQNSLDKMQITVRPFGLDVYESLQTFLKAKKAIE